LVFGFDVREDSQSREYNIFPPLVAELRNIPPVLTDFAARAGTVRVKDNIGPYPLF